MLLFFRCTRWVKLGKKLYRNSMENSSKKWWITMGFWWKKSSWVVRKRHQQWKKKQFFEDTPTRCDTIQPLPVSFSPDASDTSSEDSMSANNSLLNINTRWLSQIDSFKTPEQRDCITVQSSIPSHEKSAEYPMQQVSHRSVDGNRMAIDDLAVKIDNLKDWFGWKKDSICYII